MEADFFLKSKNDRIPVMSDIIRTKIKVFQKSNPNFIGNNCKAVDRCLYNPSYTIYEYEVKANATPEMISCFIQSAYTQKFPKFDESNIDIYHQLASEFEYEEFEETINKFESKQPFILLNSFIRRIHNQLWDDLHEYESKIAAKFDFYIQNDKSRRKIIQRLSLTQIHRILSNEKLKIEDHLKFYQFIKELLNHPRKDENEDEIGLLLQFVDFKQLKGPSITDFISMSERYQLHIPGLNSTLHEQLEEMKQEIESLKEQNKQSHNQLVQEINELRKQNGELIQRIQSNQEQNNQLHNQLVQEINELREQNKQEIQSIENHNQKMHTEKENKINQRIEKIDQQFANLSQEFSRIKSDLGILQKTSTELKTNEKSIDDTNKRQLIAITEIKNWIEKNKPMIEQLPTKTEETQKHLETQNQSIVNFKQQFNDVYSLLFDRQLHKFEMNETNEGIFSYLRGKQTNEFSPLFYTSESTVDFYEMMNWDSVHRIGCGESGSFWHEFKFEEAIHFSEIKLQSRIGGFPRSFDIKINNEVVYSTKDATELNGEYKEMTIQFKGIKEGNIVRIEQTGESWNNSKYFIFNKIELYSTDEKYKGGVFKSLMKRYGNDPHKIHVIHSSEDFDHNSFHKIDSTTSVCTLDDDHQYFDIEFSNGRMIVNGIRFRNLRNNEYLLKGSNNKSSSNEEWETINIKERKQINSNNDLWFYEVEPSTPFKYFRIMNTQTKGRVRFDHLDFFGSYISIKENTI